MYDLLRLMHLHHSSEKFYSGLDNGINLKVIFIGLNILSDLGVHMQQPNQTNVFVTLGIKTLTNMFK